MKTCLTCYKIPLNENIQKFTLFNKRIIYLCEVCTKELISWMVSEGQVKGLKKFYKYHNIV